MKKVIAASLILASASAMAWGPHEQGLLLGGIIGYVIGQDKQQHQVVVQPQPVYVPQPVYTPQPRVYSLPPQQPVYEERTQYEPSCSCYIKIYNQIGWK